MYMYMYMYILEYMHIYIYIYIHIFYILYIAYYRSIIIGCKRCEGWFPADLYRCRKCEISIVVTMICFHVLFSCPTFGHLWLGVAILFSIRYPIWVSFYCQCSNHFFSIIKPSLRKYWLSHYEDIIKPLLWSDHFFGVPKIELPPVIIHFGLGFSIE